MKEYEDDIKRVVLAREHGLSWESGNIELRDVADKHSYDYRVVKQDYLDMKQDRKEGK